MVQIEGLLSEEECSWILSLSDSFEVASLSYNGLTRRHTDQSFRKSEISYIHKQLTENQRDKLLGLIKPTGVTNLKKKNEIHLLKYNEGSFFKPHVDGRDRYKSLIIQLSNSSDYDGGELVIDGKPVSKEKGTVIMFDSQIKHEVKLLTKGQRMSLILWLHHDNIVNQKTAI